MKATAMIKVPNQIARSTARLVIFTVQRSTGPTKVLVVWVAHVKGRP
jgi:hypothetical protein